MNLTVLCGFVDLEYSNVACYGHAGRLSLPTAEVKLGLLIVVELGRLGASADQERP